MKICLVTGSFPEMRCGVGDYTRCLANELIKAGHQVTVLTSDQKEVRKIGELELRPEIRSWRSLNLWHILRELDRINPRIVHLQYPSLGYGRGLAPNLLLPVLRLLRPRIKCIITLHEYAIFSWLGKLRLWLPLAIAHGIICTNHHDRRKLRRMQSRAVRRVRVIPLGSSVGSVFENAGLKGNSDVIFETRPELDRNKTWLVHFGTVMPNKGWEIIIQAYSQLKQEGCLVGMLVVGELDDQQYAYHSRVKAMIQEAGLSEHIRFTGFLSADSAGRVIGSCRIAVLPFYGGARLNRSSMVAMLSWGLAVLTTTPDRPLEKLRSGRHFWTVEPDSPRALAEGIKTLLDDPMLVERLQTGAREAAERFSWKSIVQQTQKLYTSC
ncbi:glycosyltransferase family 4 protein [bacterium]|nr:glycosyltransferase family 4 protein [bacterium]